MAYCSIAAVVLADLVRASSPLCGFILIAIFHLPKTGPQDQSRLELSHGDKHDCQF
jgi:hypothetical protein